MIGWPAKLWNNKSDFKDIHVYFYHEPRTLQKDVFEQVKIHVCKLTSIAFFSSPPFFAPNNAFSCTAITYSPFAICAARHIAIPTVLPYNTSCKNIMIQYCAVYFLWKPKNIIHLTKFIWKKNQVLTLS